MSIILWILVLVVDKLDACLKEGALDFNTNKLKILLNILFQTKPQEVSLPLSCSLPALLVGLLWISARYFKLDRLVRPQPSSAFCTNLSRTWEPDCVGQFWNEFHHFIILKIVYSNLSSNVNVFESTTFSSSLPSNVASFFVDIEFCLCLPIPLYLHPTSD